MTIRQRLLDDHPDEALLFADGFDAAIIGVVHVFTREGRNLRVLYDYMRMVEVAQAASPGTTREEIEEHLEVNVLGAYVGEATPAYAVLYDRHVRRVSKPRRG